MFRSVKTVALPGGSSIVSGKLKAAIDRQARSGCRRMLYDSPTSVRRHMPCDSAASMVTACMAPLPVMKPAINTEGNTFLLRKYKSVSVYTEVPFKAGSKDSTTMQQHGLDEGKVQQDPTIE